ncbi:MAG: glycosyltransferase family A protein [Flavobacteriaceae bacterium]|nr:glycosyltransferase family A protein [Flavobacteriaceae bacterium]
MRIGNNPNKDKKQNPSEYNHQVIIPVYIPNEEGYFKDSFKIFQICLESLVNTVHSKTFITVVNNGSCPEIFSYLNKALVQKKIHEVIHTENIGKLNAILKGLAGNEIKLVTITDADILFLPNWQSETIRIFNSFPKAGVVGLIPQFKLFGSCCGNLIFDNFFSNKLKFTDVINTNALIKYYESIGWERNYNQNYLLKNLTITSNSYSAIVGSGHVVATYHKCLFKNMTSFINAQLGANSESYLDEAPLKKGLWRLTTQDNFAYHLGNLIEPWMEEEINSSNKIALENGQLNSYIRVNKITKLNYFIKTRLFVKVFSNKFFRKLFYKYKGLPKEMIDHY